jgi:spoIIIJ-associated protein
MTLKRRFFSAPTLTQALLAAARHHGVDPDEIAYQQIDKRQGFIKAPRGVAIEVDPDAPTRTPTAAMPTPAPPQVAAASRVEEAPAPPAAAEPPASELEPGEPTDGAPNLTSVETAPATKREVPCELATSDEPREHPGLAAVSPPAVEAARQTKAEPAAGDESAATQVEPLVIDDAMREAVAEAIDELACLAALRVQVGKVESDGESLVVEIEGPDGGRVVAHGGRPLLAMQHLLPRLLFARLGRSLHCHLDCEGFHSDRSARLEETAHKAAERVRRGGRSWLLEPMAPDERRLIHLALAEVPDIETESVGEGFLKRVRVMRSEG